MDTSLYNLIKIVLLGCITYYALGTLSKPKEKKVRKDRAKVSSKTVTERGLVVKNVKAKDIIDNYLNYCDKNNEEKSFKSGLSLGYVTPWNSHGYDVAKKFKKFNVISPVWLQIKRKPRGKYIVEGCHDIDQGWVNDVRSLNHEVQVVPRVLFDGWSEKDFKLMMQSEDEIEDMINVIVNKLEEYELDGIVLEMWSQLPAKFLKGGVHVVQHFSQIFRHKDLTLIMVLPPPLYFENRKSTINHQLFQQMVPMVDAFSVMTYDYMSTAYPPRSGPTSPLHWIETCVNHLDPDRKARSKILIGMNFYGYLYQNTGTKALLGNDYIKLLKSRKTEIEWQEKYGEHLCKQQAPNGATSIISYPTLLSIQKRLELAEKLGVGIAVWDIGQGLDYFYDLL